MESSHLAEVPKWVAPSAWAKSNRILPSGWAGRPSYSKIVAFEARAETSQFHIIQPQVVKKNTRSPGRTSACS